MAFRLPPMSSLRPFEAAARHQSFKRAAEELHITPSAVSHAVHGLEDWLGTELFHRGKRGLVLTPAGAAYAEAITQAFSMVSLATDRMPGRRATGKLAVSSAPTFAQRWLLPRLTRFAARHPDISVTIDTSRRLVEFPLDGMDLAIRLTADADSSDTWTPLVREQLVPVCAPKLWADAGSTEALLRRSPLIHVTTLSEGWDTWFAAAGVEAAQRGGELLVDTLQMAFDAASRGLGVALGRKPLVDDDLREGRLVEAAVRLVPSRLTYWLVGAEGTFDRPEIKAFRSWILTELEDGSPVRADATRGTPRKPAKRG
jgi:DNA-binding transcriptional LysR family regulator